MDNRDEFSPSTKRLLAGRVGYMCSVCGKPTIGPHSLESKSLTKGKACHITGAAKKGPRYDPNLSPAERKSASNGIWCCSDCSDVVDKDDVAFPTHLLHELKKTAEGRARGMILGNAINLAAASHSPFNIHLSNQVDLLTSFVSAHTEQELARALEDWRVGEKPRAEVWVQGITGDPARWESLPPSTQAKIKIFQARLELDTILPDLDRVRSYIRGAKDLDQQADTIRVEALVNYREGNPIEALKLLADSNRAEVLNLKAAIELELGRLDNSLDTLGVGEQILAEKPDLNALSELYRLRSLNFLTKKNIPGALLEIGKAMEINPLWVTIRTIEAIVNYFSVYAEPALPNRVPPWPEPVDLAFVKLDNESQERLQKAKQWFQQAATQEAQKKTRLDSKIWFLACLCNMHDGYRTASDYCQTLLSEKSVDPRALVWAALRNLDVSLPRVISELTRLIKRDPTDILRVIAVVAALLTTRHHSRALRLLTQTRSQFESSGNLDGWRFWRAQALLASGDDKAAARASREGADQDSPQRIRMLSIRARASSREADVDKVMTLFKEAYATHNDYRILYDLFEFALRNNRTSTIVDLSEELVSGLRTFEGLRIAAHVAVDAQRYDVCLKLLDDWVSLAPAKKLPSEMRRLRAFSLAKIGKLPDAVSQWENIVQDERSTGNLFNLVNACFANGDVRRGVIHARDLLGRNDIRADHLLRLAAMVRLDDLGLAQSFWQKANGQNLPDELIGPALSLGFALGLEGETVELHRRMATLAEQGKAGFWRADVKEAAALIRQNRDNQQRLWDLYKNAEGPIHFIAEIVNIPLVNLYHKMLSENESAKKGASPLSLLARHGGRDTSELFVRGASVGGLYADITAILLSEHVGILSKIEQAFKPIAIAPELIPALLSERDRMGDHQPLQSNARRAVFDECSAGRIQTAPLDPEDKRRPDIALEMGTGWAMLFGQAQLNGGFIVDHFPLTRFANTDPPTCLNQADFDSIISPHSIVRSLLDHGPISQEEYNRALERIGVDPSSVISQPIPKPWSRLYFHGNTIDSIARAGLLGVTCDRFQVFIEGTERQRLEQDVALMTSNAETRDWLASLIERVSRGLSDGTYIALPSSPKQGEVGEAQHSPAHSSLRSLMECKMEKGGMLWIDDRYMTSFSHRDGAPIVGTYEVLRLLLEKKHIDEAAYFQGLLKLRKANVMFIPPEKEEVLFHLNNARSDASGLVETTELMELRRYVARCLLGGKILQKPPLPAKLPNPHGELGFVVYLARSVNDAILELWQSDDVEKQVVAKCEWILQHLYLNHLGLMTVIERDQSQIDPQFMLGLSFSVPITSAITLDKGKGATERRVRYFHWLNDRMLRARFDADPQLLHITGDVLKNTLIDRSRQKAPAPEKVMMLLLQRWYNDLPKLLQQELSRDSGFMSAIGLENIEAVSIEGYTFGPTAFYDAVSRAIAGDSVTIRTVEGEKEITFAPVDSERRLPAIKVRHGDQERSLGHPSLSLLFPSITEREAFLRKKRLWLDVPGDEFDRVIAEIASDTNPRTRIEKFNRWWGSSATCYYDELRQSLESKSSLERSELLPPSFNRMSDYLRLRKSTNEKDGFVTRLNGAGEALMSELGLRVTLIRLLCLPCPLPKSVVDAFLSANENERKTIILDLLPATKSPLTAVHVIRLLSELMEDETLVGLIQSLLDQSGREWFSALEAILDWTIGEFSYRADRHEVSSQDCLAIAWLHSSKLLITFASVGFRPGEIVETFSGRLWRIAADAWTTRSPAWWDIAHPRNLRYTSFVLSGLHYATRDSKANWKTDQVVKLLDDVAFPQTGSARLPSHEILFDSTLAHNSIGSFLGGDRSETIGGLLGGQIKDELKTESLSRFASSLAGDVKRNPKRGLEWALIYNIIGDFPPYSGFRTEIAPAILECDFLSMLKAGDPLAETAILAACRLAGHLGDQGVADKLRNELISIAKLLNEDNKSTASSVSSNVRMRMTFVLAECASALSLESKETPLKIAVGLIEQLVDIWPRMGETLRPHVQRMCDELPVDSARHLWKLLVRLRQL